MNQALILADSIMAMTEGSDFSSRCTLPSSSPMYNMNQSFNSVSSSSSCDLPEVAVNAVCISLIPEYHLDYARSIEIYDFCTNGLEQELDEYDIYQMKLRSSPTRPIDKQIKPDLKRGTSIYYRNMTCRDGFTSKPRCCVFCKNNGETLSVYGSHVLKDECGRVTCPILRRYTCPICGCSGDMAHTLKYCPMNSKRKSISPRT